MTDTTMIPLAEAARRLGWTWGRAFNACLRGDLHAVRGETGRWRVSAADVARLSEARQPQPAA